MPANKRNIFVIIGSASKNSANENLVIYLAELTKEFFSFTVLRDLKTIPHFDPELSAESPPQEIVELRNNINKSDGVIICTPEYIFSIPSGLKNAIEWCVATTIFTDKTVGLITASANGEKGHEELKLLMKTVMAKFTSKTTLLIQGIKGKINGKGEITDKDIIAELTNFVEHFSNFISSHQETDSISTEE